MQIWIAIPVHNEAPTLESVLRGCSTWGYPLLVVNDGSTDASPEIAQRYAHVLHHPRPLGYGHALRTAFQFAYTHHIDVLITLDADGQHPPQWIPKFLHTLQKTNAWVVSGSRYHPQSPSLHTPPPDRRRINRWITYYLRRFWDLPITDAFCGYKAYTLQALSILKDIQENGYAMPLEAWIRLACAHAPIVEIPVPLLYPNPERQFPQNIQTMWDRWRYYVSTLRRIRDHAPSTLLTQP